MGVNMNLSAGSIPNPGKIYAQTVDVSTLPTTVDWVKEGWVNPVQDQARHFNV